MGENRSPTAYQEENVILESHSQYIDSENI